MLQLSIKKGARILIGAPANPMPRAKSDAIAELIASIGGIAEAHLPQCFIAGMEQASQVLVIVIDAGSDQNAIVRSIGEGLARIFPSGESLDFLPLAPSDPLMQNVREAGCLIYAKTRRSWWKFW